MQHYTFPKIGQFRNTVRAVNDKVRFAGIDENKEPIFDNSRILPELEFVGTVKVHGTNASVVVGNNGEIWYQSRNGIITPNKDNAGFANWASDKIETWNNIASNIKMLLHPDDIDVVIRGEWCGKGIQKGVAISELPKMFIMFGIDVVINDKRHYLSGKDFYLFSGSNDESIYSTNDFENYEIRIDFEHPELIQNELNRITDEVERCCPIGKHFGVKGVGEGVVWKCITPGFESSDFWFKVKGEKHSKSKVKTLANVDVERFDKIKELAEHLANKERLNKVAYNVFDLLNGGSVDIKKTGEFIKAVMTDIFEEESDTISESGFTGKDINKHISTICKKYMSWM